MFSLVYSSDVHGVCRHVAPYKVQQHDTVDSIAERLHVSQSTVVNANGGESCIDTFIKLAARQLSIQY